MSFACSPATAATCGAQFPEVVQALQAIDADWVIDGELVVCDDYGRPQWDRLQKRSVFHRPDRVAIAAAADPACMFAFDLHLPYRGRIRCAGHFADSSTELWAFANQLELEESSQRMVRQVTSLGAPTAG